MIHIYSAFTWDTSKPPVLPGIRWEDSGNMNVLQYFYNTHTLISELVCKDSFLSASTALSHLVSFAMLPMVLQGSTAAYKVAGTSWDRIQIVAKFDENSVKMITKICKKGF